MKKEVSQTKYLANGTLLNDRYQITGLLGQGSFGITYQGFDTLLECTVAIKEYFPKRHVHRNTFDNTGNNVILYDDEDGNEFKNMLDKFLNEARLLSQFKMIDSVVTVQDFFYENNTAYIVMEYIDGISLKDYVKKNGALSGEEMLNLFHPVLDALTEIHHAGLIHRDISPDNILLSKNNSLVLIDFGSVREANYETGKTLTIVFKRGFSPEEQYRNKGKQGIYSDVYALCATMYFCLTAIVPDEALERIFSDNIVPLTDMPEIKLSARQKRVIMKGISVRAELRYQNIESLKQALWGKNQPLPKKYLLLGLTILLVAFIAFQSRTNYQKTKNNSRQNIATTAGTENATTSPLGAVSKPAVSATPITPIPVKTYKLPNVKGKKISKAKKQLKSSPYCFKVKITYTYSNKPSDTILSQKPKAGTSLTPGSKITLTVSRGLKPTPTAITPKISGKNNKKPTSTKSAPDLDGMIH